MVRTDFDFSCKTTIDNAERFRRHHLAELRRAMAREPREHIEAFIKRLETINAEEFFGIFKDYQRQWRETRILRQKAWDELVDARGLRYRDCTIENYVASCPAQQEAVEKIRAYHDDMLEHLAAGHGVVFYGPRGTGKDHLLMALMRRAILDLGLVTKWRSGGTLLGDPFGGLKSRVEAVAERDLYGGNGNLPAVLAISDPAPPLTPLNGPQASLLLEIVDERYSRRLATWVTLNCRDEQHANELIGAQTVDRLTESSLVIHFEWTSWRRPLAHDA